MSANLPQFPSDTDALLPVAPSPAPLRAYEPDAYAPAGAAGGGEEAGGFSLARFGLALHRYRWLIVATTIVGTAAGYAATRFIDPQYVVQSTVYATPTSATGGGGRTMSDGALTQNAGWRDLMLSFAIIDPVVRDLALYLRPKEAADSALFASFRLAEKDGRLAFIPGNYTLKTAGGRFTLTNDLGITTPDVGTVGDSIGRSAGFAWVPPARLLGTKARTVEFRVMTPREASLDVRNRTSVMVNERSPFIYLVQTGTTSQRPAATLNAMMAQFVTVAGDLKQRQLVQQATALGEQLDAAQTRLRDTERQLENYRINTIAKPSEGAALRVPNFTGGGGGIVEMNQPVLTTYQINKYQFESLQRDRRNFADLADALRKKTPGTTPEVLLNIAMVASDPSAEPLRATIKELGEEETKLRKLLAGFTDSVPEVKTQRRVVAELRDRMLPQRMAEFADVMKQREVTVGAQMNDATTELREIPTRTTQQGALQRELGVATETYTRLRLSYADANLARQSAVADVKILDAAVTPLDPTSNTAPKLIGFGILGGLGFGVVLAFLLDRLDSRFRYPDQVRQDLGLEVLGAVPRVNQERQSPESVAQIVEAFRAIRMNVRYAAAGQRAITFGITSPSPGDGKSLVASNLALSFAEGGWRTVVIDADTRRGQLNATFDVAAKPGLVDYLEGSSLLTEVLYPTRHDNLTIVPCGTRHRRAPELLTTPRMKQLLAALANEFDVIIIDTPPLGAGTDAYAIGTACGQLVLVLRHNRSNLKLAKAKLAVVSQLPISMMGAILNEVQTDSMMYQYYSYDPDYVMAEETPALAAGGAGGVAVATRDGGDR